MRGVPEKRQTPEAPSWQRILINHWIFENCIGAGDEFGHIEPVKMPTRHRRQKVLQSPAPIPVARLVLLRLDVAHPIHKLPALGVDIIADRIDQKLRGVMPANADHARARQDRLPARNTAPHIDPGIFGRPLVRKELLAQDRMNAFSADDDAAALARQRLAVDILEMRDGLRAIVFNAGTTPAGYDLVRAGALDEGFEQNHLEVAAMNRKLRES